MDRELAMALTTATADDDEKCPDDVMKRLVKLSGKQKDPAALEDLVATLAAKLQDGSFKVKLKTLRCTMMVLNDKRSVDTVETLRASDAALPKSSNLTIDRSLVDLCVF